ncbi:hypothetical protein M5D96_000289 [Drosophila gunungcola]|uniref:Uncharacterized protein n=1 Tax=Drosophila gunungcola TaxID=103775 RepID=A0A9P9YWM5_9MUSC|nr:hypothetical protein M5D96_000289 [Drosophila gunungcola]
MKCKYSKRSSSQYDSWTNLSTRCRLQPAAQPLPGVHAVLLVGRGLLQPCHSEPNPADLVISSDNNAPSAVQGPPTAEPTNATPLMSTVYPLYGA